MSRIDVHFNLTWAFSPHPEHGRHRSVAASRVKNSSQVTTCPSSVPFDFSVIFYAKKTDTRDNVIISNISYHNDFTPHYFTTINNNNNSNSEPHHVLIRALVHTTTTTVPTSANVCLNNDNSDNDEVKILYNTWHHSEWSFLRKQNKKKIYVNSISVRRSLPTMHWQVNEWPESNDINQSFTDKINSQNDPKLLWCSLETKYQIITLFKK